MGDKRISIRTLPSGEKVTHYPADAKHPDGKMELIPGESALKLRRRARLPEVDRRQKQAHDEHIARVEAKAARGRAKGLPAEKSPIASVFTRPVS